MDGLIYLMLTSFVSAVAILVVGSIIMCAWPVILLCVIIFLLLITIKNYTTYFSDCERVEISTETGRVVTFSREDYKNKNSPRYKFLRYLRKKGIHNIDQVAEFFAAEEVDLEKEIADFESLHKQKISEDFWDNKY